jgi:Phospholipase_D-nuclease N-terminal
MTRKHWRDLPPGQRKAIAIAGMVQWLLAAIAWVDLARRPAESVHGRKPMWAAIIAINFVGPLAYLRWGRIASREMTNEAGPIDLQPWEAGGSMTQPESEDVT